MDHFDMHSHPDETVRLYKHEDRPDLLEDAGHPTPPQRHQPWYSRMWSRVKCVFSNKQQQKCTGGGSAADERRSVLSTGEGAANVEPLQKKHDGSIIRNKGDGRESKSGETITNALNSKNKYNNIIGVPGRYGSLNTGEGYCDIRVGNYSDLEITVMESSGSSMEIGDFRRIKAKAMIHRDDDGSVDGLFGVDNKDSGKSTRECDKNEAMFLEDIVDDIQINSKVCDTADFTGSTRSSQVQQGSAPEELNLPKSCSAIDEKDDIVRGQGHSIKEVNERVEGNKSIITATGGFGGGSVFEKRVSIVDSAFPITSDSAVGYSATNTGGRSAKKDTPVGGGLLRGQNTNLRPGSRGQIRIGSTWNHPVHDFVSTTRSPDIVMGGYSRILRAIGVVPDIENANVLPEGYVRVGRVESSSASSMLVENVGGGSRGVLNEGPPFAEPSTGIQSIFVDGNAVESGNNLNVGAAGPFMESGNNSDESATGTGSGDDNNILYGVRRQLRWERDTPLFFKASF